MIGIQTIDLRIHKNIDPTIYNSGKQTGTSLHKIAVHSLYLNNVDSSECLTAYKYHHFI